MSDAKPVDTFSTLFVHLFVTNTTTSKSLKQYMDRVLHANVVRSAMYAMVYTRLNIF